MPTDLLSFISPAPRLVLGYNRHSAPSVDLRKSSFILKSMDEYLCCGHILQKLDRLKMPKLWPVREQGESNGGVKG